MDGHTTSATQIWITFTEEIMLKKNWGEKDVMREEIRGRGDETRRGDE